MDPLSSTMAEPSPWNWADTPRTHDLKHLRAKRVAYYESIGIIKGDLSRDGSQPASTASQDTNMSPSKNQTLGLRYPQKLPCNSAIEGNVLFHQVSKVGTEGVRPLDQMTPEEHQRTSYPVELDLHMLADALVPETQKLWHVINWAQKCISNSPEEHGSMSPRTSLGHFLSNLGQSVKALRCKNSTLLLSSDSPTLPRKDISSQGTDSHGFSLSHHTNLSGIDSSPELSSSIEEADSPGKQFSGCQEAAVRTVKEGIVAHSFKQAEFAPQEDRTERRHILNSSQEEMFPEWLGCQSPLIHTYEESKDLGEAGQSLPMDDYFWAPLADSSDVESLKEPRESRGLSTWIECQQLGGSSSSFTNDSTQVSHTTILESSGSSSGEQHLVADFREHFKGAEPVELSNGNIVKSKANVSPGEGHSEDLMQNLPGAQLMSTFASLQGKGKELGNVRLTLRSPQIDNYHRNEWKRASPLREGNPVREQVPRSNQKIGAPSCALITQRQFGLVHHKSHLAPQIPNFPTNLLVDPSENVPSDGHWNADVFCEPTADPAGTCGGSMRRCQSPPPRTESRSVHPAHGETGKTSHLQKEKRSPSSHPTARDISQNSWKGSFLLQEVGGSSPKSGAPPPQPEPGASVLETYFYYVHVLNKMRGFTSEEENSPLLSQGPKLSEREWGITSTEGKVSDWTERPRSGMMAVRTSWLSKMREESSLQDKSVLKRQLALEEPRLWKPQSHRGRKPKRSQHAS